MRPGIRLIALALLAVAVLALWLALRPRDDDELADPGEELEEVPAARMAPAGEAPAGDEPSAPEPLAAPPDDDATYGATPVAPGSREAAGTVQSDAAPLEPEMKDQARALLIPGLGVAIDDKDLEHLQKTLAFVREHRSENLLSDGDLSALEAAIACLEGAPEARDEARDLLGYGTRTALSANLQRACGLR